MRKAGLGPIAMRDGTLMLNPFSSVLPPSVTGYRASKTWREARKYSARPHSRLSLLAFQKYTA